MSQSSPINLQSTRDFTTFQFQIAQGYDAVGWQVRFVPHKDTRMFEVELKPASSSIIDDLDFKVMDQPGPDVAEMLLLTVDVYSERYPHRVIYLKTETSSKAKFYRTLVEKYLPRLTEVFRVDFSPEMSSDEQNWGIQYIGFLLSRKPVPYLNLTSVETVWKGTSRLLRHKVTVVMEKTLRVSAALPRKNS